MKVKSVTTNPVLPSSKSKQQRLECNDFKLQYGKKKQKTLVMSSGLTFQTLITLENCFQRLSSDL